MWAGISGQPVNGGSQFEIAISIHDSVYATDFASFTTAKDPKGIEVQILDTLRKFSTEHLCKFLGAGVTLSLLREVRPHRSPRFQCSHPSRLQTFVPGCGLTWTSSPLCSTSSPSIPILLPAPMSNTVSHQRRVPTSRRERRPPPSTLSPLNSPTSRVRTRWMFL